MRYGEILRNFGETKMKNKIVKQIQRLSGRYSGQVIFLDWVHCISLAISNTCTMLHNKLWHEREEEYKAIMNKYSEKERHIMGEMAGLLTLAYESEMGDILGEIYMESIGGNKNTGQFFTPYQVSLACAKLTVKYNGEDTIRIHEPTCGSGGMIVASAQVLKEQCVNYQKVLDVVCQDLDWTAVYMCYVQLSLLGIRATVVQGNTLTEPFIDGYPQKKVFYTPAKRGLLI